MYISANILLDLYIIRVGRKRCETLPSILFVFPNEFNILFII